MSGGGGKGSNTSSTTSSPPPEVMENYKKVMDRANSLAGLPLTQYQGPQVAPFTPMQDQGFAGINAASGSWNPSFNNANTNLQSATGNLLNGVDSFNGNSVQGYLAPWQQQVYDKIPQFSGNEVQKYMDPYLENVVGATRRNMQENNAVQQNDLRGNAISKGAWGGDRAGIAAAELSRQQKLSDDQTIGNLYSQGYGQALGQFNNQQGFNANLLNSGYTGATGQLNQQQGLQYGANAQQANNRLSAAGQYAGLGNAELNNRLAVSNAMLGAGGQQQGLAQQFLNVPYQQFQQQQSYPWQTTQYLNNLATGAGGGMGGTSSSTSPGASPLSQLGGLGLAGYGLFGGPSLAGLGGGAATLAGLGGVGSAIGAGASGAGGLAALAPFLLARGGVVPLNRKQISDGLLAYAPGGGINYGLDGEITDLFDPENTTMDMVQDDDGVYSTPMNGIPDLPSPPQSSGMGIPTAPQPSEPDPTAAQPGGDIMSFLSKGGADPKMAMITAGLSMAAGTSPDALTNIARGGLTGVANLEAQRMEAMGKRKQIASEQNHNRTLDLNAKKLEMEAEQFKDTMGLKRDELDVRRAYYQSKGAGKAPKPKATTFKTRQDLGKRLEEDYPEFKDSAPKEMKDQIEKAFMATYRDNGGDFEDAYEQAVDMATQGKGIEGKGFGNPFSTNRYVPTGSEDVSDEVVSVSTPDEARALPKGTKFKTPDGRVKVR